MIWPRGFPLSEINLNFNNSYFSGPRRRSAIQQAVVNGDPDVDAIFRLTKSMQYKRINLFFDPSAPSLQLPLYKMSPFNAQNTLYCYEAFWSLYLPFSVSIRVTDIWRSYWAQRLMWLTNQTLSFHGPSAYQMRSAHSYLKDFEEERAMYSQTERLVKFLFEWKCKFTKFYDCVIDLSSEMANEGFWKKEEVDSIKLWLKDLNLIGYVEPKIVNFDVINQTDQFKIGNFDFTVVRYTPNFQISIDEDNFCCKGKSTQLYNRLESFVFLKTLCDEFEVSLNYETTKLAQSPNHNLKMNISLVITFNPPPTEYNIIILTHLYREHFQNLIFCGLNIMQLFSKNRGVDKKFDSYTFIDLDFATGSYHYFCMNKAVELNLDTDGFFLMSDDVMLKFWKLKQLDPKKIWFLPKKAIMYDYDFNGVSPWIHWPYYIDRMKNLSLFINSSLSNPNNTRFTTSEIEILNSFQKNFNGSLYTQFTTRKFHAGSDWFYLPRSKFQSFHLMSMLFRRYDIFLEIAVPYILTGLDSDNSTIGLDGRYDWLGHLLQFKRDYPTFDVFYHPFKLSWLKVRDKRDQAEGFCGFYVQEKFNQSLLN
jgi:hypothetical protein